MPETTSVQVKPTTASVNLPRPLVVAACVIIAAAVLNYGPILKWLYGSWVKNPDMSHGFLVPIFAGALLWLRREDTLKATGSEGHRGVFAIGVLILLLGVAVQLAGIYNRVKTLEAWSMLPFLLGVAICCGGIRGLKWAWPSIIFLFFMFPLPQFLAGSLSGVLQRLATISSTYILQLMGVPAVSQGNIIWLSTESVGVAEACNGLRMMTSFLAMAVAVCFTVGRPLWQKLVILGSVPLIAIVANVIRITATGVAYEFGSSEAAKALFHDLAGWLMMPIGIGLLLLELAIISRVVVADDDRNNLGVI